MPRRGDHRVDQSAHAAHFLFTWLKTQRTDDALVQPYGGHATRRSLETYSRLALG